MILGVSMVLGGVQSEYPWIDGPLNGLVFAFYACAFYISLAGRSIFRGSILPE